MENKAKEMMTLGLELSSEKNISTLLEKLIAAAVRHTAARYGVLYLREGTVLRAKVYRGAEKASFPLIDYEKDLDTVKMIEKGSSVFFPLSEAIEKGAYTPDLFQEDAAFGNDSRTALFLPLVRQDGVGIGIMKLFDPATEEGDLRDFREEDRITAEGIAAQGANSIACIRMVKESYMMLMNFVESMTSTMEKYTPSADHHTSNMVTYGCNFLRYLKGTPEAFSDNRAKELVMSIWLHDIGKMFVPHDILDKTTRLWPAQKKDILSRMEIFRLKAEVYSLKGLREEAFFRDVTEKTEELLAFVEEADTKVVDDRAEKLEKFAAWRFPESSGEELPYLTEAEITQLSEKYRTVTEAEMNELRKHASITEEILSTMYFPENLKHVPLWAGAHHELLNGKGYPKHLSGDEIPTEVRIITILDIFEAITSQKRDYKNPKTPEEAIAFLHRLAGNGELDEKYVTLFEESRAWE